MDIVLQESKFCYNDNKTNILGIGSFGKVYRGTNLQNGEDIAIKIINKTEISRDEYMKAALQKELEIQKLCNCKYSTKLIDTFEENNNIYIIMELCDTDLEKVLQQKGSFDINLIRKILTQLNQVFCIMYKNRIIHRDLKLPNILIKYTNVQRTEFDVKLADFGMSTIVSNNIATTSVGTPLMAAPEVLRGQSYTNQADIWSLGVIIYQMYFNKLPYVARNIEALLTIITHKDPPLKPHDPQLADLIYRMLRPKCNERLTWEEYFKHSFFGENAIDVSKMGKGNNEVNKAMWVSVHQVAMDALNKQMEKDNKNKNNNDNSSSSAQQQQQQKPKQKFVFENLNTFQLGSNKNYKCLFGNDKLSGKKYFLKQYWKGFVQEHKEQYEQEKKLFQLFNKEKISTLIYVDEMITNDAYSLIFEFTQCEVLLDYVQRRQLPENRLHEFIVSCLKDIFIPLRKLNINLDIITISSFAINPTTYKAILFDCGLIKQINSKEQNEDYYIYPEERNTTDEKTNVLGFGITIYKALFNISPFISKELKEIPIPEEMECSNEFKQFLGFSLYRNKDKRGTFEQLLNHSYIKNGMPKQMKNKSLFSMQMLNCILTEFTNKYNAINAFIKSDAYQQLPEEFIPFTCLFVYSTYSDMRTAIHLFEAFNRKQQSIINSIDVVYASKNYTQTNDIDYECLDMSVVMPHQCYCDNDVLTKINEVIQKLKTCSDPLLQIINSESTKYDNFMDYLEVKERICTMMYQFLDEKMMNNYVKSVANAMKQKDKVNGGELYLKYLYEHVIMLYEMFLEKPKIHLNGMFYEINDMYFTESRSKGINISLVNVRKKQNACNRTMTSFMKKIIQGYISKDVEEKLNGKKQVLKNYNEFYVGEYIEYVEGLEMKYM